MWTREDVSSMLDLIQRSDHAESCGTIGTTYNLSYNTNYSHSIDSRNSTRRLEASLTKADDAKVHVCIDMEWSSLAKDYTQSSTLHGLRYVGDTQLHLTERLFWSVTFVLGILAAAYFITMLYERWEESPMIIALSPKPTLLETIPFPAVTICNMNGARRSIAQEILNNPSSEAEVLFEKTMLSDICGPHIINSAANGQETRLDADWSMIRKFLIKVSQPCHEMLVSCKWRNEPVPCNDIFNPELTDEGMCCSFNKVNRNFIYRNPRQSAGLNYTFPYPGIDWNPEVGYPDNITSNTNPWRAWGAGRSLGLSVTLDAELHEHFCSSTSSAGFKLLLHNPVETPKIRGFAYFLNPGTETRVEILPSISSATRSVVNIPQNKRRCFFSSDRELRFYRTYTQKNCELECQSNNTFERCRCVPYYLPKDVHIRICGTADEVCVEEARSQTVLRLKDNETSDEVNLAEHNVCDCLPSCITIQYGKQMSSSVLDDNFIHKRPVLAGKRRENLAVAHFFFLENTFTSFEKGEIFGFTDFLASTGGLLGLFLGFSFMSAAEIAYFLTLRLICTWARNTKRNNRHHDRVLPFAQ